MLSGSDSALAAEVDPMQSETQPMNLVAPLLGLARRKEDDSTAVLVDIAGSAGAPDCPHFGLVHPYASYTKSTTLEAIKQIVIPGVVLVIGVSTSIITLCTIKNATI